MLFQETTLPGAFLITLNQINDERGSFTRSFCKKTFEQHQLFSDFVQHNISCNQYQGTLRGLHYQAPPHEEVKIVSCRRGAIFDVIVDIRKNSSTFGQWMHVELSEHNHQMLYIPAGFAHGFQTLCDHTEVNYLMGNYYCTEAAQGIRWDDPQLNIPWPTANVIISERDQNFPRLAR